jgi:4-diphosphocytidyl-2-C-methyl-D-erythritol kinase
MDQAEYGADWPGFAPAKVNLTLRVTGRRADGYHLLDSLVVFAGVGDRISVRPSAHLSLEVTGPFGHGLATEVDNLVLRAARCLAEATGVPARGAITLEKNLPVSSGIGGGSADAAAALRVLARFWDVALPEAETMMLALGLGADVPACLASRPVRMQGIGETLSPVPQTPAMGIVLVNPGIPVSTPAIFRARSGTAFSDADAVPAAGWSGLADVVAALALSGNDLEAPAVALAPVIGTVLAALRARPGCLLARMSGSGATCFGLFADVAAAQPLDVPGWWSWGGGLYEPPASAL